MSVNGTSPVWVSEQSALVELRPEGTIDAARNAHARSVPMARTRFMSRRVRGARYGPVKPGFLPKNGRKAMAILGRRGPLAQLVEQGTLNPKVVGSIPTRPTSLP